MSLYRMTQQVYGPDCMYDYFQVANKLFELHVHLKDLGHPDYLNPTVTRFLECKTHSESVDRKVLYWVCVLKLSTFIPPQYSTQSNFSAYIQIVYT